MSYTLEQLQQVGIYVPTESVTKRLTSQQEAFCQAYVFQGLTKTAAYIETYNVGEDTARNTINGLASRLSKQPNVRARIDALYASRSNQSSLDTVRLKDIAVNKIVEIAEQGGDKLELQAALAIAKMPIVGLYEKVSEDDENDKGSTVLELTKLVNTIKKRLELPDNTDKLPSKK